MTYLTFVHTRQKREQVWSYKIKKTSIPSIASRVHKTLSLMIMEFLFCTRKKVFEWFRSLKDFKLSRAIQILKKILKKSHFPVNLSHACRVELSNFESSNLWKSTLKTARTTNSNSLCGQVGVIPLSEASRDLFVAKRFALVDGSSAPKFEYYWHKIDK